MSKEAMKLALEKFANVKALCDKHGDKINRKHVYGGALIEHFDVVCQALAEQPAQQIADSPDDWSDWRVIPPQSQPAPMIRGDIRDGLVDDEPAHQHIEHCLWARNGNQPCPHVQPAQQGVTIDSIYKATKEAAMAADRHQKWLRHSLDNTFTGLPAHSEEPQPAQQNVVAWESDRGEIYYDKEDAFRYSDGFIRPLVYGDTPQAQPAQSSKQFDTHAAPGQSFDTHSRTPQQEPVGKKTRIGLVTSAGWDSLPVGTEFYTSPPAQPAQPSKPWVGLTVDEIEECYSDKGYIFARAIEAKLKEKNT